MFKKLFGGKRGESAQQGEDTVWIDRAARLRAPTESGASTMMCRTRPAMLAFVAMPAPFDPTGRRDAASPRPAPVVVASA